VRNYFDSVFNTNGQPVSGAFITVNIHGGGLATIYSDNGLTTIANPTTSSALGRFNFYVANGRYDITVSGTGISTVVQSDVIIIDDTSISPLIGTVNGSNTVFTTSIQPGTVIQIYRNGILQRAGSGNDYTISGNTITFATAPLSGDILIAIY